MNFLFFAVVSICLSLPGRALAAEDVTKIVGGPSSIKMLEDIRPELEQASGKKLDLSVTPRESGVSAFIKGFVDGIATGEDPELVLKAAASKGLKPKPASQYEWIQYASKKVMIALHPSNPVKELNRQQLTDIFSGKIKNWKDVGGTNTPIRVLIAKDLMAASKAVAKFYLNSESVPAAEIVLNKDGLVKGVKAAPGAMAVLATHETLPDFKPYFFELEAGFDNFLLVRRPVSPTLRKLLDHLRARKK